MIALKYGDKVYIIRGNGDRVSGIFIAYNYLSKIEPYIIQFGNTCVGTEKKVLRERIGK